MRSPIKATAQVPINRPDTYQRLPQSTRDLTCEVQPVHTFGSESSLVTKPRKIWSGTELRVSLRVCGGCGRLGASDILAWTVASDIGYSFAGSPWSPRLGLKANIASGDGDLTDGKLETFNALFPKLPYFTEANLVAPANFMDVHPTITVTPLKELEITIGWDVLWKQQAADAFYAPPLVPVAGTEGSGRFIGHQASIELAYEVTPNLTLAGSYVHFWAGDDLKDVGGRDGDYVGAWTSLRF